MANDLGLTPDEVRWMESGGKFCDYDDARFKGDVCPKCGYDYSDSE